MQPEVSAGAAVLDRAGALDRVGGDAALLGEIARLFLLEYPALLAEIRSACARGDARELERAAHTLKGAAANFCARPTVEAAFALERIGRSRELSQAREAVARLEAELGRMHPQLSELADQGDVSAARPRPAE
ncbi:MAG TPA: Hpt domain-containing protein [Bryobacteraceae bacterium]|nr:Hpt domain-containing protein [Bryobacteraceae bacterium]